MKRLCSGPLRPANHFTDDFGIDRIILRKSCGSTLSLHRFLGRWIIMRVTDVPDGGMLPGCRPGIDGVTMNVVTDPDAFSRGLSSIEDTVVDHAGSFERSFPGLHWPATFVIDPAGRLVAILTDESYEPFVQTIVRNGPTSHSDGAVDLGDIDT